MAVPAQCALYPCLAQKLVAWAGPVLDSQLADLA